MPSAVRRESSWSSSALHPSIDLEDRVEREIQEHAAVDRRRETDASEEAAARMRFDRNAVAEAEAGEVDVARRVVDPAGVCEQRRRVLARQVPPVVDRT